MYSSDQHFHSFSSHIFKPDGVTQNKFLMMEKGKGIKNTEMANLCHIFCSDGEGPGHDFKQGKFLPACATTEHLWKWDRWAASRTINCFDFPTFNLLLFNCACVCSPKWFMCIHLLVLKNNFLVHGPTYFLQTERRWYLNPPSNTSASPWDQISYVKHFWYIFFY